jgi:adenylate kinase
MEKQYKILIMGPQGSGKGTQAELLSEKLEIPAFGMGQLLRDEIAKGSEIGKEADAILKAGNLVSDEMAAEVLKQRLQESDTKNGYLLDGYPRNAAQMAAFNFDTPTHVVVIDIPENESLKRLGGRLTCKGCEKVFAEAKGFKEGNVCECGSTLYRRDDDTPEAIKRRLEIYQNDTKPIITEYEKQGIMHHIDGVGTIEEVYGRILNVLELES